MSKYKISKYNVKNVINEKMPDATCTK